MKGHIKNGKIGPPKNSQTNIRWELGGVREMEKGEKWERNEEGKWVVGGGGNRRKWLGRVMTNLEEEKRHPY